MRFATRDRDFWELDSGEARHAAHPDSFEIPARGLRETLTRGQAAKLLFVIETEDEDGRIDAGVERMWVVVSEAREGGYLGRLINRPASIDPDGDVYLRMDCEVPFAPEHVIAIDQPPQDFLDRLFEEPPAARWDQDTAADTTPAA